MSENSCAVLVHSCDKYSEAWELFFSLFFRAWKECPFQVYLSTEYNSFDNYKVKTINTGEGSWTRRLHKAVDSIDSQYIIILLEDFFLQAYHVFPFLSIPVLHFDCCIFRFESFFCVFFFKKIRLAQFANYSTFFFHPIYFCQIPCYSSHEFKKTQLPRYKPIQFSRKRVHL